MLKKCKNVANHNGLCVWKKILVVVLVISMNVSLFGVMDTVNIKGVISVLEDGEETEFVLDHLFSVIEPNIDNDLFHSYLGSKGKSDYVSQYKPFTGEIPENAPEGYDYVYFGGGNLSQYYPALFFKNQLPGVKEEEDPLRYTYNGQNYYSNYAGENSYRGIEGLYFDGVLVEPIKKEDGTWNRFSASWGSASQYLLVDKNTGKGITTYCADLLTYTEDGFGYNMENVEDADYYDDAQAAKIRAIAKKGFWGDVEGRGSLLDVKKMMTDAKNVNDERVFTDDEVNLLTEGMALTATQMAIWSCSNYGKGVEFVNVHYVKKDKDFEGMAAGVSNIPEANIPKANLIFKLYDYLRKLKPETIDNATTANTVISKDRFLKDASISPKTRIEGHVNNIDNDDTNDAYLCDVYFSLQITPSDENRDNLLVTLKDAAGNVLAKGRVAGEVKEGETKLTLNNGQYIFENIPLIEGEQGLKFEYTGTQNLEEGVYLYTSEVRDVEEESQEDPTVTVTKKVTSQTLVGLAKGHKNVAIELEKTLRFSKEEPKDPPEYPNIPPVDPTPTPTPTPTPEPTEEPIVTPTVEPTPTPTVEPTEVPELPTEEPEAPTSEPTVKPTVSPQTSAPEKEMVTEEPVFNAVDEENKVITDDKTPLTYDENMMVLYLSIMICSLVGIVVLLVTGREENKGI